MDEDSSQAFTEPVADQDVFLHAARLSVGREHRIKAPTALQVRLSINEAKICDLEARLVGIEPMPFIGRP